MTKYHIKKCESAVSSVSFESLTRRTLSEAAKDISAMQQFFNRAAKLKSWINSSDGYSALS